jgi:hypothetical protein
MLDKLVEKNLCTLYITIFHFISGIADSFSGISNEDEEIQKETITIPSFSSSGQEIPAINQDKQNCWC